MIDIYVMIGHFKSINLKTILRPSIVGGKPLKRTHVVPSVNFECTPRAPPRIPKLPHWMPLNSIVEHMHA